ncbi:hypothetical protein [Falsiroseomonas tokyonensis]|uniref:Uncharacterized protein n=1 Tax=Falsiroseomonas tokyonensis TaxID=430521 RepID=A0ABV7BSL3_9PROT|nr:hypothetical protein [Falsiroseomonas tokyonensis]MBU8537431.1 hypothetical protein [Falsiroseomonas tokyonensis]
MSNLPRQLLREPAAKGPTLAENDNHPGAGPEVLDWHRGDGDDTVIGGGGGDTLRLIGTGLTPEGLLARIETESGSPAPRLLGSAVDVTGVVGRIVLGSETVIFRAMERLILQGRPASNDH